MTQSTVASSWSSTVLSRRNGHSSSVIEVELWPDHWHYDEVCHRCRRYKTAFSALWSRGDIYTIKGCGLTVVVQGQPYFVCEQCARSLSDDQLLSALFREEGEREWVSPREMRETVWYEWQRLVAWPENVMHILDQAAQRGIINCKMLSQIEGVFLPKFQEVLSSLHVWRLPNRLAEEASYYVDNANWEVRETWISSHVSIVENRPVRELCMPVPTPNPPAICVPDDSSTRRVPGTTSIACLDLPPGVITTFAKYSVQTIEELSNLSMAELLGYQYVSRSIAIGIQAKMLELGWSLQFEVESVWRTRFHGRALDSEQEKRALSVLGEEDYTLFRLVQLSPDDEERIWARNALIIRHDKLAHKWANMSVGWMQYCDKMWTYEDVLQEARIGLQIAIEHYDLRRGIRFSTVAFLWIRQYLYGLINRQHVYFPAHTMERILKLEKTVRELSQKLYHKPTGEELMRELGWSNSQLEETLAQYHLITNWRRIQSLDQPYESDSFEEGNTLGDRIEAPGSLEESAVVRNFQRTVQCALTESQILYCDQWLLRKYWGFDEQAQSIDQLAQALGLTPDMVRLRLRSALDQLRTEEVWEQVRWFYPGHQDKSFEEVVPQYVHLEEGITRQIGFSLFSERERVVIRHRLGLGGAKQLTLEELGERFTVTRERIRQVEAKVLKKLCIDASVIQQLGYSRGRKRNPDTEGIRTHPLIKQLDSHCQWPSDDPYPVINGLAEFFQLPRERFWESASSPMHEQAQKLAVAIFIGRGWTLSRIRFEIAMMGFRGDQVALSQLSSGYIHQLATSAKIRRQLIAVVGEINTCYQQGSQEK